MDSNRLSFLLEKRQRGELSHQENEELLSWYNKLEYPLDPSFDKDALAREMLAEFRAGLCENEPAVLSVRKNKPNQFKYIYRVAATVLLICSIATLLYLNRSEKSQTIPQTLVQRKSNRFVTLPDGSVVILKANSKLSYLNSFRGKSREVSLVGEAYFDIKKDPKRPFVIHTGKISTRVLGTAFNIDARPGNKDIVVTVTRGKVQVEDKSTVLAVLLPGKQVTYNRHTSGVMKEAVDTEKKTLWAKQNMLFDAIRFGDIASYLSDRYGKRIRFAQAELAECPITASFAGGESFQEVLDILCMTRGASYAEKEGYVEISGAGCADKR